MDNIFIEALLAVGRLFLHPLTYIFIFALFWYHITRVKRERKDFHTRVHDVVSGIVSPIPKGLLIGLIASVAVILIGIEVPYAIVPLITLIWMVQLPFRHARWYSLTVTLSVILLLLPFLPEGGTNAAFLDGWLLDLQTMDPLNIGVLLVILFAAETTLILNDGAKQPSPRLRKSSRGKIVGEHMMSRIWILPVLMLFPAGSVSGGEWWPLLNMHSGTFGFIVLPFLLGFQTRSQAHFPETAAAVIGKRMSLLVILSTGVLVAAFFYPVFIFVLAALILIGRELLFITFEQDDSRRMSLFSRKERGLQVVSVLPKSTGEKMGILAGETVFKVNGIEIETQREFYDALQWNSAYAKLEVFDSNGEKRFAQGSIYAGDHYLIGCLFIPDDEGINLSLRGLRSSVLVHRDRKDVKAEEAEPEEPEHVKKALEKREQRNQKTSYEQAEELHAASQEKTQEK